MKRIAFLLLVAWLVQTFCPLVQQSPAQNANNQIEDSDVFFQAATHPAKPKRDYTRDVENLLGRMTLEEKVGQMTQLQIGMVTTGKDQTIQIDQAKLEKAVMKYGVGSILNVSDQALTVEKWHEII